jgi:hypothetical protein
LSEKIEKPDYTLDFTTSSAISKLSLKFLVLYIPIFWFAGVFVLASFFLAFIYFPIIVIITLLPLILLELYYVFIFACVVLTRLFLVLVELIHKPKEGIFRAEEGNKDFEFWRLRIELKKLGIWLLNNCPIPYSDAWAFRWFGVKMDFSSHLYDAWCDMEFIKMGHKVMIGQGAVVMSSMVVGKYLIIKEVIFDDYAVIGGQSTVSPGTRIGTDTMLAALSNTTYNQKLEPEWIYFGVPSIKLKKNKYAEKKRDLIMKKDVDEEKKFEVQHEVNINEDLKIKE